jgi:hypothetical protein
MEDKPSSPRYFGARRESSETKMITIGNSVNLAISVDNILENIYTYI